MVRIGLSVRLSDFVGGGGTHDTPPGGPNRCRGRETGFWIVVGQMTNTGISLFVRVLGGTVDWAWDAWLVSPDRVDDRSIAGCAS